MGFKGKNMICKCHMTKISIFITACLVSVIFAQHAECAAIGPVDHVRNMLNEVMAIQNNPGMEGPEHREERKRAIKAVIARNVDMNNMAETALGDYWKTLDGKQRAEFTSIFRDLFQDSYTRLVLDFLKQEQIRYYPEERTNGESLVKTVIYRPNEQIPVDYRLAPGNGKWLVRDVTIDGVSIVKKYHSAFTRVIKSSSYSNLLGKMRIQQKAIQ